MSALSASPSNVQPLFFAIIPAAGRSQRMGRPKLLLPWQQRTVIETVIQTWLTSRAARVVVVVHSDDQRLIEIVGQCGVDVVTPSPPPPEMKDSIAAALRYVTANYDPTPADAWLLAPADMPELSAIVIDRLIAAHQPGRPRILAPLFGGRRGHPVLFPWALAEETFRLAPHEGVNQLLARHEVQEISMAELPFPRDFDTPEEFQRLSS